MTRTWEIKHHQKDGDLVDVPQDQLVMHRKMIDVMICPLCASYKERFLLVDVSSLPPALTKGHKWACDGCWTSWERNGVVLPDGRQFDESIMYELMGAPQEMVDDVAAALANRKNKQRGSRP